MGSGLVDFMQSLQGTVWQDRLLFLQQNTETYRWVALGVFAGVHLIFGIIICLIGRKKLYMNVSSVCFVPGVNLLVIPWGFIKMVIQGLQGLLGMLEAKPAKEPRVKKNKKSSSSEEFDLGFGSDSSEDDAIDLF